MCVCVFTCERKKVSMCVCARVCGSGCVIEAPLAALLFCIAAASISQVYYCMCVYVYV